MARSLAYPGDAPTRGPVSPWLPILGLSLAAAALPTELALFERVVAELDQDGDRSLSAAEYARVADAQGFAVVDRDGSGGIDADELRAHTLVTPIGPGHGAVAPASVPAAAAAPAVDARLVGLGLVIGALGLAAGLVLGRRRGGRRRTRRGRRR